MTPDLQSEYDDICHALIFAPLAERGTPEFQLKVKRHRELTDMIAAAERRE